MSTTTPPAGQLDSYGDMQELFQTARLTAKILGFVVAGIFTVFQFKDLPLSPFTDSGTPQLLIRIALILYFWSWVIATPFNLHLQSTVFTQDPHHGRVPVGYYFLLPMLLAVGALLAVTSRNERYLALAFSFLLIIDLPIWWQWVVWSRRVIEASKVTYLHQSAPHYSGVERLNLIENYISGRWQWGRYVAMVLMLIGINIFCFDSKIRLDFASTLASRLPGASPEMLERLLPALSFFLYVVVAELWIWAVRIKTMISLRLIKRLASTYKLQPL